jgi:phosphopantetheinyl transferase (holo-ACP synthase)
MEPMNLPIKNCIITEQSFSTPRVKELLQYPHLLTYVLLDLQKLEEEINQLGEERALTDNLSREEQDLLSSFTLAKRKREWIGGRFAAKFATSRLLEKAASQKECMHWSSHIITTDKNGRPSLSAGKENTTQPYDISISHSASMAAAMAIHKGYCGIDVQKVTPKVMKVSDRFCTNAEKQIMQDSFPGEPELQAASLTKLWAAKEALRKASAVSSLPGFLELELIEITSDPLQKKSGPWGFNFNWKSPVGHTHEKYRVAVTHLEDYALALTARDDTPE